MFDHNLIFVEQVICTFIYFHVYECHCLMFCMILILFLRFYVCFVWSLISFLYVTCKLSCVLFCIYVFHVICLNIFRFCIWFLNVFIWNYEYAYVFSCACMWFPNILYVISMIFCFAFYLCNDFNFLYVSYSDGKLIQKCQPVIPENQLINRVNIPTSGYSYKIDIYHNSMRYL